MGKKNANTKNKTTVVMESESDISEGQAERNLEAALGNAFNGSGSSYGDSYGS